MTITKVTEYTGGTPGRNQSESTFNTNIIASLEYQKAYVPELNDSIDEMNLDIDATNTNTTAAAASATAAAASANATVYSGSATYDYPDSVIGSDGNTYRCLDTGVTGDNPVGSSTGKWHNLTSDTGSRPNEIINPNFSVNTLGYDFTATKAATEYFIPGWFNIFGGTTRAISFDGTNGLIPGAEGIAQLYGARVYKGAGNQLSGIVSGENITITCEITSGSISVAAGYGTSSGAALTTSSKGTLTSSTKSLTFQASYGASESNLLAILLTGTGRLKWVKIERGSSSTPWLEPKREQLVAEVERFICTSYDDDVAPGTVTNVGAISARNDTGGAASNFRAIPGKVRKMDSTPTITIYSTDTGAAGEVYDIVADADVGVTSTSDVGTNGFASIFLDATIASGNSFRFQYVLDSQY